MDSLLRRALVTTVTFALACSGSPTSSGDGLDEGFGPEVNDDLGSQGQDVGFNEVGVLGQVPRLAPVERLYFAVIGDTRPNAVDDTAHYPTDIIQKIFSGIEGLSPRPQFALGTGDYQFSSAFSREGQKQLDLYRQAASGFTGELFAAMGNHECTGRTGSNCTGRGNNTYRAYMGTLVQPVGQALPYYSVPLESLDSSWTAKVVMIACNAWTPAQRDWLATELARPTTYTFVVRHEPSSYTTAPCMADTEQLLAQHPYTLLILGHEHTFKRLGTREVVVGTGGAQLKDDVPYGFATVEQVTDGFRVTQYDYATALPVSSFTVPF